MSLWMPSLATFPSLLQDAILVFSTASSEQSFRSAPNRFDKNAKFSGVIFSDSRSVRS